MRTVNLSVILVSLLGGLSAADANPRLTSLLESFDSAVVKADIKYQEAVGKAAEERDASLARTRNSTLKALKRMITSRTDASTTAEIYRAVLSLDQEDADARRFFQAIGTLDDVLADLEIRVETDVTGTVVAQVPQQSPRTLQAAEWLTPSGGTFTKDDSSFTLTGPGTGSAGAAMAVLASPMPARYTVTGELLVSGSYGGFLLAGSDAGAGLSIYSINGGRTDAYVHANPSQRRRVVHQTTEAWPKDRWVPFSLTFDGKTAQLVIDGAQPKVIQVPEDATGDRFGLIVYHRSTISVRSLVFSK
jgi:hypothetical protein